ncbi:MAG: PIN domain-containing protein [Nanoarchaeota archaeon]
MKNYTMTKYLFDTYAIIEIIEGNSDYEKYVDEEIIINDFVFAELCYSLIKTNYSNLDLYIKKYEEFSVPLEAETIKKAMQFRHENKKKKLSMTDCISYFQAKELGIKFLTGDKEFENLENVEFIK